MVVVGIASYQDKNEAYPLDKKTLNQIALRSFLVKAGKNAETAESIGWAWAMAPGLKKIHTNEDDYKLALGHHLEYVDSGYYLAPFAMGMLLAMEQQKPDLETLRSVRTTAASLSKSLSGMLMCLALPGLLVTAAQAVNGNTASVIVYAAVMVIASVWMRFASLRIGYSRGTRIAEKTAKNMTALKKAAVAGGAFMLGAVIAVSTAGMSGAALMLSGAVTGSSSIMIAVRAFIALGMTMLLHYLLERKNWSLGKCALLVLAAAALIAFFVILTGSAAV